MPTAPQPELSSPVHEYLELRPLLQHVRVMEAVMARVEEDPTLKQFYDELLAIHEAALQDVLAPHAMLLAMALVQLENAFPEIRRAGHAQM